MKKNELTSVGSEPTNYRPTIERALAYASRTTARERLRNYDLFRPVRNLRTTFKHFLYIFYSWRLLVYFCHWERKKIVVLL